MKEIYAQEILGNYQINADKMIKTMFPIHMREDGTYQASPSGEEYRIEFSEDEFNRYGRMRKYPISIECLKRVYNKPAIDYPESCCINMVNIEFPTLEDQRRGKECIYITYEVNYE